MHGWSEGVSGVEERAWHGGGGGDAVKRLLLPYLPYVHSMYLLPHTITHSVHACCRHLFTCCHTSCPFSPPIFFPSHGPFHDHCNTILRPPSVPPGPDPNVQPTTPCTISTQLLHPHPQSIIGLLAASTSSQLSTRPRTSRLPHYLASFPSIPQ
jgi:hypothetical protein